MAETLAPLPPCQQPDERRSARWPMQLSASIRSPVAEDAPVVVADLSTHGCQLLIPGGSVVGRFVTLAINSFLHIEGWIAWSSGDRAGLAFAHRVPAPVISELVRRGSMA